MSELIDIYIKLQIALITLLVPMLIFYINYASVAKKAKDDVYDKKIIDLQKNSQFDRVDPTVFKSKVSDLHSQIQKLTLQKESDAKLLNPLRQMKRIYGTLLSSFVLILLDIAIRNNYIDYNHNLSYALIIISVIFFVFTLCFVWKVAKVAIQSKEDIERL